MCNFFLTKRKIFSKSSQVVKNFFIDRVWVILLLIQVFISSRKFKKIHNNIQNSVQRHETSLDKFNKYVEDPYTKNARNVPWKKWKEIDTQWKCKLGLWGTKLNIARMLDLSNWFIRFVSLSQNFSRINKLKNILI